MNTTKKKILDASRKLLNQKGLSAVSQRTIANHLEMSPGNLTYHFKKRNDIIEALYFELVEKMDQAFLEVAGSKGLLDSLHQLTKKTMYYLFDYRFMMLDFIQVMREYPNIKKHYQQLMIMREQQFQMFFQLLIQEKLMREENLPNEYKNLILRMMILGDFWLSNAEISSERMTKKQVENYFEITVQTIYPYLTAKGKRQFLKITNAV